MRRHEVPQNFGATFLAAHDNFYNSLRITSLAAAHLLTPIESHPCQKHRRRGYPFSSSSSFPYILPSSVSSNLFLFKLFRKLPGWGVSVPILGLVLRAARHSTQIAQAKFSESAQAVNVGTGSPEFKESSNNAYRFPVRGGYARLGQFRRGLRFTERFRTGVVPFARP